jgi:hypothetical protein
MIGASLIIFGGYNNEFMNDLHHVSLFGQKKSLKERVSAINEELEIIQLEADIFRNFLK